ncbi:hypothetical protein B0H13DRAFT_1454608, partial [Mycena leptocephala]
EVKWDHDLLIELVKTSFRSCKAQWREQMDEEVAKKEAANRKVNRMRDRRFTKAKQPEKAVDKFALKYGLNPKSVLELIHEQLMSDEASGPEETDMRGPAAWKTRMAFKAGLGDISDAELAKRAFLEVLDVPWRSEEMSDAVHEMTMIAFSLLGEQERKRIQYTGVRNTGRVSSRIPETAPYNFGINKTWLEMYKDHPDYRHLLVDWDTYPDPEGFGTN